MAYALCGLLVLARFDFRIILMSSNEFGNVSSSSALLGSLPQLVLMKFVKFLSVKPFGYGELIN